MPFSALAIVVLGSATGQDAAAPETPPVELLAHDALSGALHTLAAEHPELVTLAPVGRSRAERWIEAVRIAAPGADAERPAILVVAGLEGPRVFESGVALHHARRLAQGYADDERVRALLDAATVYVLPRANLDPAEARFATPRVERYASGPGVDDDRDGRQGEDEPADVDGDGAVTTLRVEDPEGEWIPDPTEPRALVRAKREAGERGRWRLWTEGRDLDGDERVAEDAERDARVDRNFPAGWREHTGEAGHFPGAEPETRALMDFVIAHPDIALVLAYDALDDLVEPPKAVEERASGRVPPAGVLAEDAALLAEIGERYRETTEGTAKGSADDTGTFQRWCYEHRGLSTLSVVLWELADEAPEAEESAEPAGEGEAAEPGEGAEPHEEPSDEAAQAEEAAPETEEKEEEEGKEAEPSADAKHLAWIDASGEAWRFDAWTPFEHPELGPVEIGGFAPWARIEPPEGEWTGIAERQLDFLLELGAWLPRVRIVECTAEALGAGVWQVEAAVENGSLLPLQSQAARRARTVRPARVELVLPEAGTLLSGERVTLLGELAASGGREELRWLVLGPVGMEIGVRVESDHAGIDRRVAEVVR
jgi:hypothetical protein